MTPTIEITAEQAQALSRGEDITIVAPENEENCYIIVFDTGNVFKVLTYQEVPTSSSVSLRIDGECTLIAKGPHDSPLGTTQSHIEGTGIAVICRA